MALLGSTCLLVPQQLHPAGWRRFSWYSPTVCGAWALRSLPAMALRWLVDSNCKAGADTCNGPPGPAQYGHWLGSLRWAIGRNIVNVPHASQAYS